MALFGSKKSTVKTVKKVKPTVVRTQNVAKELVSIAKSYEVKVDTLDFNILEVQTYTRMTDGTKETEWEDVSADELYELDDQSALLNPLFQIKQMYEVEIFSKDPEEDLYKNFKLAVGANATKCKVYLSIGAGSAVSYSPRFEQELLMLINKRKVRSGILINIFDEMLSDVISKITAFVRVEENAVYREAQTILIAESYEPTATTNDALILHYDEKEKVAEDKKMDYASRGFIESVYKDELLIEYIKPLDGKPGRNCRGEFMKPEDPVIANEPAFNINETITQTDNDLNIEYKANENGYIVFENNTYFIKTEVDVGEISFKTTGSISTGLDSDVSISVKETDAVKDAIGTGMSVEVSEIDIEGNVGSNAMVTALKATIGGQTHKTATIKADKLQINVHKGNAYGKNIRITRLEHGVVDGDIVEITQAIGGSVRAKEITMEICASYVKATASKLIEIKKLQGSENVFTIDPLVKKGSQEDVNENKDGIKELESEIRDLKKDVAKYSKLIKDGTASFLDIKKRLVHYKKNGVKMPDSFVKKYKQFQGMQAHLKETEQTLEVKSDQHALLATKTSSFGDNIFDARIINRNRWMGHNELVFKLVDPPIEIKYSPEEGSEEKIFGLVEVEEGEYEIQAVTE